MKITTYSVKELSGMYFPHSSGRAATTQLKRWLELNTVLQQRLAETGYVAGQKLLTPRQVALIVDYLGEP